MSAFLETEFTGLLAPELRSIDREQYVELDAQRNYRQKYLDVFKDVPP